MLAGKTDWSEASSTDESATPSRSNSVYSTLVTRYRHWSAAVPPPEAVPLLLEAALLLLLLLGAGLGHRSCGWEGRANQLGLRRGTPCQPLPHCRLRHSQHFQPCHEPAGTATHNRALAVHPRT